MVGVRRTETMKVSKKDVSDIKKELEVSLPSVRVSEAFDAAYQKIGQKARLKGFRPGKVPRSVLEQYYKEDAENEVIQHLIRHSYADALQETGIVPVSSPDIKITAFGLDQDFGYSASVETRPSIDVKGYEGLKITSLKVEVTEEEIRDNLKSVQERLAQLVPVTGARKLKPEDVVTIDYEGSLDGKPVPNFKAADFLIELGKGAVFPELEQGILEMSSGEKKVISVNYPEDWADKTLAGRKVDLEVSLKEIKEKKLPEINDDLAKDLGSFASLDELKARIREDLSRSKEQNQKADLRRQVMEKLIQENIFEVPEAMIQEELEHMLQRLEGSIRQQGATLEQSGITKEGFFQNSRDEAIFRVKGSLLFDEIAHKEKIEVTPPEVGQRIEDMAKLSGQSPDAWKRYYKEKNLLNNVAAGILEEKTLDFILSKSKIEK